MKKIFVYGSHMWGSCPELKEYISENEIKFAYFDIRLDFGALKRFLNIRDNNSTFDPIKEANRVGLPTILIDDEIMIGFDKEKLDEILD